VNRNIQIEGIEVSIVIVSYNTQDLTLRCIASIYKHFKDVIYEIILIDNASVDNTVFIVSQKYPEIKIKKNLVNLGFGKANNIGINCSIGKYVFLVNSDIEFLNNNVFELIDYLKHNNQFGGISPRLIYPDGEEQPGGQSFPTFIGAILQIFRIGRLFRKTSFLKSIILKYHRFFNVFKSIKTYLRNYDIVDNYEFKQFDWVTAACLLLRKDILLEVNGFDENIFLYSEDLDLAWRLNKIGYLFGVYGKMKVIHHTGKSSSGSIDGEIIKLRSLFYVYKKIFTRFQYYILKIIFIIKILFYFSYKKLALLKSFNTK